MSVKSKGTNAERDLVHMFWAKEPWAAIRVAGSGSNKYPSPDVIASDGKRRIVIEAKVTKNKYKYLTRQEIEELKIFSEKFSAEAWVAVKFARRKWAFISLEDLEHTSSNHCVTISLTEKKGLSFEELTRSY